MRKYSYTHATLYNYSRDLLEPLVFGAAGNWSVCASYEVITRRLCPHRPYLSHGGGEGVFGKMKWLEGGREQRDSRGGERKSEWLREERKGQGGGK